MKTLILALVMGMTMLATAQADDTPAPAMIEIHNFKFVPAALTVHKGASVTWSNSDETPHTVAGADKSFRSAALDTGDKFTHAFTQTGTYTYFCTMHPQMTGTITVVP